ncbi:MAG: prenyltransferase/squalene oxidase repeat-containing protein, partial [Planctomycetota bacterium]
MRKVMGLFLILSCYITAQVISDKVQIAIDKGLKYLLKSQKESGQIGSTSYYIGSSSLAGLAMFAGGYTPVAGKFGKAIEKLARFLMKKQYKSGFISEETNQSRFHGHSFALIFLSYVYSESKSHSSLIDKDEIKQKIIKAIRILEKSQLPDGGFPYSPHENFAENSTVVCCVAALRSVRDAGFKVRSSVIKKGIEYIRKCANPDGSFAYNLEQRHSSVVLTVNGMMNLIFYGSWKDSDLIKKGFKNIKNLYESGDLFDPGQWEYYGTFFAALSLYYLDEELWNKWFPKISEKIVKAQRADGSWEE